MTRLSRIALAGLLGALMVGTGFARQEKEKPKLETVSYADLGKLVRSYKGKPLFVYVWAHY